MAPLHSYLDWNLRQSRFFHHSHLPFWEMASYRTRSYPHIHAHWSRSNHLAKELGPYRKMIYYHTTILLSSYQELLKVVELGNTNLVNRDVTLKGLRIGRLDSWLIGGYTDVVTVILFLSHRRVSS